MIKPTRYLAYAILCMSRPAMSTCEEHLRKKDGAGRKRRRRRERLRLRGVGPNLRIAPPANPGGPSPGPRPRGPRGRAETPGLSGEANKAQRTHGPNGRAGGSHPGENPIVTERREDAMKRACKAGKTEDRRESLPCREDGRQKKEREAKREGGRERKKNKRDCLALRPKRPRRAEVQRHTERDGIWWRIGR